MAAHRRTFTVEEARDLILDSDDGGSEFDLSGDSDDSGDFDPSWVGLPDSSDRDSDLEENVREPADRGRGHDSSSDSVVDPYDVDTEIDSDQDNVQMFVDDEEDGLNEWVKNVNNFPLNAPFTGVTGFQVEIPDDATPLFFYKLFVNNNLIKLMKSETNTYARETIAAKEAAATRAGTPLSARSIYKKWNTVTENEIRTFLSILIHMGIVKKPRIIDYWSVHPVLHSTFASKFMKRTRFRAILTFFHLNSNAGFIPRGEEGHDPLHKLRPFFDHLKQKFESVYFPEENVCIDEAMCPWRGRGGSRVYMREKPTKWGIKLYELCESSTGYVYTFEVMCHQPGVSNSPHNVCHRLMGNLKNQGRTLYIDNYYCCPTLAHSMAAEDTAVVGTVRANRVGMPKDLVNQPMRRGDVDYRRQNEVCAVRWKDKRDVHVLTTKHDPTRMVEVRSRTERKFKPEAVVDYIHNMAGVDHSDQMVSYMPFHRKTFKWWRKLAFHLITLVLIQAHCLCNKNHRRHRRRPIKLEEFAVSVCKELAESSRAADQAPATGAAADVGDVSDRLTARHFLEPIPIPPGQTRKQLGCIVCYAKGRRGGQTPHSMKYKTSKTQMRCKQCTKPLCVYPCFEVYHTKDNYAI